MTDYRCNYIMDHRDYIGAAVTTWVNEQAADGFDLVRADHTYDHGNYKVHVFVTMVRYG